MAPSLFGWNAYIFGIAVPGQQASVEKRTMMRRQLPIPNFLREMFQGHPDLGRKQVFKFHHEIHSDYIYNQGSIKIGTLAEYRIHEKQTIKDSMDGVETMKVSEATNFKDIHPGSLIQNVVKLDGCEDVIFENVTIIGPEYNFHVYCFSYSDSQECIDTFVDESSYTCTAICSDIFEVADLICNYHPKLRGCKYFCLPVIYKDNFRGPSVPRAHPLEIIFEKSAKFKGNREGRIVFLRPDLRVTPLHPWSHPKLIELFRPHIGASG